MAKAPDPDEGQVREHDPREQRGQGVLAGIAGEAGRHGPHDPRREDDAEGRGHGEDRHGGAQHGAHHARGLGGRPPARVFGDHGDQRRGQRALAEKPPEHVGDAVGHEEGVGGHPGSEGQRDDHVPDEPENPAQQGRASHGGERAEDLALDAVAAAHLAIPGVDAAR